MSSTKNELGHPITTDDTSYTNIATSNRSLKKFYRPNMHSTLRTITSIEELALILLHFLS